MINRKFGRLTVIKEEKNPPRRKGINGKFWLCKCDCGKLVKHFGIILTRSKSAVKSCGCLRSDKLRDRVRLKFGESAKNRLFTSYMRRAKNKHIPFTLTRKQFFKIVKLPCHYCGIKDSQNTKTISPHSYGHITYTGIDRKNNSKGYTLRNSLPCCRQCNLAKYTFSYKEFLSYLKRVANFRKDNA